MRRSTAATLAMTCMGTIAGVAAFVQPPVAAEAPRDARATTSVVADQLSAGTATGKRAAASRYSRQAHKATNNRRGDHGLRALRRTDCVQRYAVRQAKAMARQTEMYHQELGPILDQCDLTLVGENVAYGYPSGRAAVVAWMHSPGHRANILNPPYRLMGIGARKGEDGLWYVAQVFGTGS